MEKSIKVGPGDDCGNAAFFGRALEATRTKNLIGLHAHQAFSVNTNAMAGRPFGVISTLGTRRRRKLVRHCIIGFA